MQIARVIGKTTASVKHESMNSTKMLIVQPQNKQGKPDGYPLITIDGVGAGEGDSVMITSDGRHSRALLNAEATPVRWTIVGVKD